MDTVVPPYQRVLTVCAHPDDESFGLGGILSAFAAPGTELTLLCFTHGEASTLGGCRDDLAAVRSRELAAAAAVLGIGQVHLLAYPDGGLADVAINELTNHVIQRADDVDALLVFDEGGITGHPDHCQATRAALTAARHMDLPVLAWAIPQQVAEVLNRDYSTSFVGREEAQIDAVVVVDRDRQANAIACHWTQSRENSVLWRRLELLGTTEWLRFLRHSGETTTRGSFGSHNRGSRTCTVNGVGT